MYSSLLVLTAFTLSSVVAQNNTSNAATSLADVNAVAPTLRAAWCNAERDSCKALCCGSFVMDSCDPNTLVYNCTCTGNTPNLFNYQDTLPWNICQYNKAACVSSQAQAGNNAGVTACASSYVCGSSAVSSCTATTSSSASSTTAATTTAASQSGDSKSSSSAGSTTTTTTGGAAIIFNQKEYGLVIVFLTFIGLL